MKRSRIGWASFAAVAAALAAIAFAGIAAGGGQNLKVRWDIVNVTGGGTAAGGSATALANDSSKIVLTGSGTFHSSSPGTPHHVTGGGTWQTFSAAGTPTGRGTYTVVKGVHFIKAPGALPARFPDLIGTAADRSAGLVHLRIAYSDGSEGVLIVSCRLGGTPRAVFEGINASKGFVDYTHNLEPVDGVEGNRTLFHVTHEEDDD
ncbi:MAG: hypothetical protein M3R39_09610 [Actinomycetota bacterium]|nr:hypothetical protein [Actinomycetota bacterium]